jgi:hypothetical protein
MLLNAGSGVAEAFETDARDGAQLSGVPRAERTSSHRVYRRFSPSTQPMKRRLEVEMRVYVLLVCSSQFFTSRLAWRAVVKTVHVLASIAESPTSLLLTRTFRLIGSIRERSRTIAVMYGPHVLSFVRHLKGSLLESLIHCY